jgi:hypothetical protein
VLLQAEGGFLLTQAAFGHGAQRFEDFVGGQGVPVLEGVGFGSDLRGEFFECHIFLEGIFRRVRVCVKRIFLQRDFEP